MASAWEEIGSIQGKCLELCSEISSALREDVLGVPTERFTSCGDFKTKATVIIMLLKALFPPTDRYVP